MFFFLLIFFSFLFRFSLITNALNINGRSPSSNSNELRVHGFQRRLDIAPLNFDDSSNGSQSKMSEEISLYAGNTPQGSPRPCSISPCLDIGLLSPSRECEIIEERHDIDYNSMDSGYSNNSRKIFTFVQPNPLPKKRNDSPSPPKIAQGASPKSVSCFRSFNSLSSDSMESMDEDCMDLLDMETLDENAQLPTSFNTIISGNIKTIDSTIVKTPVFRRCLSMTDSNVNRGRTTSTEINTSDLLKPIPESDLPFQSRFDSQSKTFKRPEPPSISSPIQSKRYKHSTDDKENQENSNDLPIIRPVLRKSISMNDDIIMNALSRCKYLIQN